MSSPKRYLLLLLAILPYACKTPVQEETREADTYFKRSFVETNRYMRERNREHIMAFIDRAGWKMTETPTGLWYMILEPGEGKTIEKDERISYAYETRLISGALCYSADSTKPKTIVAGKGNIEAGLEEGLLFLRNKCTAKFIIPPYLAHGNFGDRDRIPGSAILIVDVRILDVKR